MRNDVIPVLQSYRSGTETPLPDLAFQYTDYAIWQREWLSGETLAVYLTHWKKILAGELPILNLPTDSIARKDSHFARIGLYSLLLLQPG